MKFFILCLALGCCFALKLQDSHPCDKKECRAGRECVVVEGEAQCLCVVSCPDHLKPVCGSDDMTYDNYCKLHQKACVSGHHIRVKHKGICKKSYDKLLKKHDRKISRPQISDIEEELQNDLVENLKKNENKPEYKKGPAACYGPQRNALRFLIIEHFEDDLKKQSWHLKGMTFRESLWGWFYFCDKNKDNYLNSQEFLVCAKHVNFFARPGQDNELTKELCISVLVDDGDRNRDLKLDFEEFTTIMNPKYEPKEKQCSLRGRNYMDGEEISEDCNHCVCAVGNWICASVKCTGEDQKRIRNVHGHGNEISNHIDFPLETSNDVIDHVEVADLWMENNRKDKERAKKTKENEEKFDVDDNLFTDFDQEEKIDERKELHMNDYYDDLYEKNKDKTNKKKILQLENALKEVKSLRKKTENLKKLLHHKKPLKIGKETINISKVHHKKNISAEKNKSQKHQHRKSQNKNYSQKGKNRKADFENVFKNTKWNDLIDWGDRNKLNMDKDLELLNHF